MINWEARKADLCYTTWKLGSATDPDIVSSTARFAADMVSYSGIAEAPSPRISSSIVLSNYLNVKLEDRALSELCQRITGHRPH